MRRESTRSPIVSGIGAARRELPQGAATPHGEALPAFFLAFAVVLVSLRVLISWIYLQTGSLLMAQGLHASSTGFLVVLGAARVTPTQEALWYGLYGVMLGAVAAALRWRLRPTPLIWRGLA